jgi:hypothetical protein
MSKRRLAATSAPARLGRHRPSSSVPTGEQDGDAKVVTDERQRAHESVDALGRRTPRDLADLVQRAQCAALRRKTKYRPREENPSGLISSCQ